MSSNGFLFTAYVTVWVIHIAYIGYLASRYSKVRRELKDFTEEK